MKLGAKGRYAVMAMTDLARHERGHAVTLADIAARQEISLAYLEQLFAQLRRRGLVRSVRGPGGGYRLGARPDSICVAEIVSAVDEPLQAVRCEGERGCMSSGDQCATHELWDALGRNIESFLAAISLEDVVERRLGPVKASVVRSDLLEPA